MNTPHHTAAPATASLGRSLNHALSSSPRASALALAAVLTLAMLGGIDTLATTDAAAPQMAQATSVHG